MKLSTGVLLIECTVVIELTCWVQSSVGGEEGSRQSLRCKNMAATFQRRAAGQEGWLLGLSGL